MASGALICLSLILIIIGFVVVTISLGGILLILLGAVLLYVGVAGLGSPKRQPAQVIYVQPQPVYVQPPPQYYPPQPPVVVNVQAPQTQPQVLLHCKYCGALNTMNPAGNFHCTSCGATL